MGITDNETSPRRRKTRTKTGPGVHPGVVHTTTYEGPTLLRDPVRRRSGTGPTSRLRSHYTSRATPRETRRTPKRRPMSASPSLPTDQPWGSGKTFRRDRLFRYPSIGRPAPRPHPEVPFSGTTQDPNGIECRYGTPRVSRVSESQGLRPSRWTGGLHGTSQTRAVKVEGLQ